MPWHIEVRDGEYCVIKDSDGEVEGCHETESDAEDQMAALYASEAERVGLIDWLRQTLSPLQRLFSPIERAWSGDASNYSSTEAYCDAALIDVNSAAGRDEKAQSHCMLPVKSPGSDAVNWEGVQAAAGGHGIQAVEKPSDVPEDAWESALKTAANKIISEYNSHDETAPDAVYEIAGKEPPKEQSMEERVVGLEMAFDQVYSQMREDEDLSQAWIHDFYLGDGGPFMVVSRKGRLYRVSLSIEGDQVTLGEMEPVEIEFKPTERFATKTVVREVEDDVYRWYSISATSVLNKDGEIDSQALFDSFVEHVERTGEYPVRRFYHVDHPKFVTGECDFVARAGHVLVTSGLYNDSYLAQKEVEAQIENPDEWGESIGYLPTEPPEMTRVSGVEIPTYNEGVLREISTVEKDNACSWFTTTALREEVTRMSVERVKEALLGLLGNEEDVEEFIGDLELTNREITEAGLISREGTEEEEEVDPEAEVQERETEESDDETPMEVILDDEAMTAIVDRFSGVVEPLEEKIEALEARLEEQVKERASLVEQTNEGLEALVTRIEELEKEDEEKLEKRLKDASPKMKRINVGYRPRVDRDNEDEDEEPVSDLQAEADRTLAEMPS